MKSSAWICLHILLGLFATTARSEPSVPSSSGCTKDTECKGDRICHQGVCMAPPAPQAPAAPDAPAAHAAPAAPAPASPPPGAPKERRIYAPTDVLFLVTYSVPQGVGLLDGYVGMSAIGGAGFRLGSSDYVVQAVGGLDYLFSSSHLGAVFGGGLRYDYDDGSGHARVAVGALTSFEGQGTNLQVRVETAGPVTESLKLALGYVITLPSISNPIHSLVFGFGL